MRGEDPFTYRLYLRHHLHQHETNIKILLKHQLQTSNSKIERMYIDARHFVNWIKVLTAEGPNNLNVYQRLEILSMYTNMIL